MPSNTSRWYSTDIGLVHMVALDMMVYPGATPDPGPGPLVYAKAQKAWLEADLKAVDREKTPWILVFAHHPLYCSSTTMGVGTVEFGENPTIFEPTTEPLPELDERLKARLPPGKTFKGCLGTGEAFVELARDDLEPLFLKYGVDLYLAGHEVGLILLPLFYCPFVHGVLSPLWAGGIMAALVLSDGRIRARGSVLSNPFALLILPA